MLTASTPASGFGRPSSSRTRLVPKDGEKNAIWVPMLNSASKGKDLPEKQLLVLGGTPDQQKEFLDQLNPENPRSRYSDRRNQRKAPISNRYTLGYTYQDVLDADQEDTLARINVYMLSNPSASFAPLLKPLFTPKTIKDTLITILLDWSEPLTWARRLRQWIRLLRSVILSLDDETKIAMEENMTAWKEKRVGSDASTSQSAEQKATPAPPLGPGEWDEGLGIPVSIVCIQSEKIYTLEREQAWTDEQFDFLMQWLRCMALKHGASLIYTSSSDANSVRTLLHSSLSIHSLLKREVAKPNYLDKDKILIPPNWDSWGKIRPLREGTDLEAISDAWSVEIQGKPETIPDFSTSSHSSEPTASSEESASAVALYESSLPPPAIHPSNYTTNHDDDVVTVPTVQAFLASQHSILETFKAQDEKEAKSKRSKGSANGTVSPSIEEFSKSNPRMAEHIGPYQINVNGIDFDAEEATRRLRERESEREARKTEPRAATGSGLNTPTKKAGDDGKASNEAMSAFFANLIKKDKRGGGGSGVASGAVSPTRGVGSPAPERRLE